MKQFVPVALVCLGLDGCAARGAPSFSLFGAYFPAWMLLALVGIFCAMAARIAMVATGLAETIRFQLLSCTAVGVTAAVVCWLFWFAL